MITRGKVSKGVKYLVYGPEGIGKTTFVSKIPGVVFIDTEGSSGEMDVLRFPAPRSWTELLDDVDYAISHPDEVKALVIDTGDWAERLCQDHVLASHQWKSIEDPGFGKGYVYLAEEFGKLLNKMEALSDRGIHCGFCAHAMMRKFEQPDELGAYDRWELKMSKKVAPLVKEWCSLMLFANYKTIVYATDDKGRKHKASGGQRVMYASHHPCWDAKNRYGLPDEMPFEFDQVASLFGEVKTAQDAAPVPVQQAPKEERTALQKKIDAAIESSSATVTTADKIPEAAQAQKPPVDYTGLPDALVELMKRDGILPFEVRAAIAQRGYFTMETPFAAYPEDFVKGVLIGAWPQVRDMCLANREETPF